MLSLTVYSPGFLPISQVLYLQANLQCSPLSSLYVGLFLRSLHISLCTHSRHSHFFLMAFLLTMLTILKCISLVHASFLSSRQILSAAYLISPFIHYASQTHHVQVIIFLYKPVPTLTFPVLHSKRQYDLTKSSNK